MLNKMNAGFDVVVIIADEALKSCLCAPFPGFGTLHQNSSFVHALSNVAMNAS